MSTPSPQSSSQMSIWIRVIVALIGAASVIIAALISRAQLSTPPPITPTPTLNPTTHSSVAPPTCASTEMLKAAMWQVTRGCDKTVSINYNSGTSFPEYASLNLTNGSFRMNYGPGSGWGTSIILLPVFWSQDACPPDGLCQGAAVKIVDGQLRTEGSDLLIPVDGHIGVAGHTGGLHVLSVVRLLPPVSNALRAEVTTTLEGTVQLDTNHPNEVFKPITLTSMYDSPQKWDAQKVYTDNSQVGFPANTGWILQSPISTHTFGLQGGTSAWKNNAPTIEVVLTQPASMNVTGWLKQDTNPQDENVAVWTTTDTVLTAWSYTVTASS